MNTNPFVLDIETIPLRASLDMEYPRDLRTPPSNYKKDEAIAEWFVRDEKAWREGRVKECSLNPRLGRVLCIGMTTNDGQDATTTIAKTEAQEADLLRGFWHECGMEGGVVVTWNGTFDLRFIVLRSLYLGVKATIRPETINNWFRRYTTFPHFDCRSVIHNWNQYEEGEGLTEWAAFFGLPEREEAIRNISGADIARLYTEGQFGLIEAYCARDVADTKLIYEKLAPMFDGKRLELLKSA